MDSPERSSGLVPVTALLALLGLSGFLLYDRPFVSNRPEQPRPYPRSYVSTEDIDARLWEDPFPAAYSHPTSPICSTSAADFAADEVPGAMSPGLVPREDAAHKLRHLAFEVRRRFEEGRDPPGQRREGAEHPTVPQATIALLAVMVPGEPYAEQSERRRRMRNAVLSGLAVSGYVPERGALIGHVDSCWDADSQLVVDGQGRPVRVPFEWFLQDPLRSPRESDAASNVLVLWLDETEFRDKTFERVDDLLSNLVGYCYFRKTAVDCLDPEQIHGGFQFRLIGPATSGTLANLVARAPFALPNGGLRQARQPFLNQDASHSTKSPPGETTASGTSHANPPDASEATLRLLEKTESYLDPPARRQLFGDGEDREGRGDRWQKLAEWIKPTVGGVLAELSKAEDTGSAQELQDWFFSARDQVGDALYAIGPAVMDSDESWNLTVAGGWANESLRRAIDHLAQSSSLLPPGVDFGRELCLEAFRTHEPSDPTDQLLYLASRDFTNKPDTSLTVEKFCSRPRTDDAKGMVAAFGNVLDRAWMDLALNKSRSPDFWRGWSGDLLEELRRVAHGGPAQGDKAGPTEEEVSDVLERLNLSAEEVDSRIQAWLLDNRERLQGNVEKAPTILPDLEVYSSRATAAPGLLVAGLPGNHNGSPEKLAEMIETSYGIRRFIATTVSDEELTGALIRELKARGIDLCAQNPDDHLALVGEWDTFYSRALTTVMEAQIARCQACRAQERDRDQKCTIELTETLQQIRSREMAPPGHIHLFHYLRGLDGSLPSHRRGGSDSPGWGQGNETNRSAKEPESEWALSNTAGRSLERAIGPRQFDYMRRLANGLLEQDRNLNREGQSIRAIGVVGSDVYDKLLVLQALRRRFPRATFFTTDLDARLSHPGDYGWNRNLLIASGFGLELGKSFQQAIPPFRDSYQTSSFLAVQLAMLSPSALSEKPPKTEGRPGESGKDEDHLATIETIYSSLAGDEHGHLESPSLFEVARSGPYKLSSENPRIAAQSHPELLPEGRLRNLETETVLLVCLALTLGVVLLAPVAPPLRRFFSGDRGRPDDGKRQRNFWLALVALFLVIVFARVAHLDGAGNDVGEPFELWEGISIWPTETLRLLAMFMSVLFLILGWDRIRQSDNQIAVRFGLPSPRTITERREPESAEPDEQASVEKGDLMPMWWHRLRRKIGISDWRRGDEERTEPVKAEALWQEYLSRGSLRHRLIRGLSGATLYILLGGVIISLLGGPHIPYRGTVSLVTDQVVLWATTGATMALIFFVVDATLLCRRFTDLLSQPPTDWTDAASKSSIAEASHLEPEDLSDLLDAELIASRTEVIGGLIIDPFVILFILLVARNGFFDNWDWPLSLIVIFGGAAAYAILCAVILRRAAERARRRIVRRLRLRALGAARRDPDGEESGRAAQLRMLIEEIEGLRRGAFAPWSKHPLVKALLLPFGGIGAVVLLDLLSTAGL